MNTLFLDEKKKTKNMQMPEEKYTISVCFFELLMH